MLCFKLPRPLILLPLLALLAFGACSRQAKIEKAVQRADRMFQEADFEGAKLIYLRALQSDAQNLKAVKGMGLIWMEQGVPLEAVRYLKAASQKSPEDLELRLKLAQSFAALSQLPLAYEEANAVLERQPLNKEALLVAAQTTSNPEERAAVSRKISQLGSGDWATEVARAWVAMREGDLASAESYLTKLPANTPATAEVHVAKASLAFAQKDRARTLEEYRAASQIAPRSPATAVYALLLAEKDPAAADQYLQTISTQAKDFLPAWTGRARLALAAKKIDEALKLLTTAFQLDPYNYEASLLRGQALLATGNVDGGLEIFKRLTSDPIYGQFPQPWLELGRAYLSKGSPTQAATAFEQAIKIKPDYSDAQLQLANVKLQQGNLDGVVEEMKSLLEKRPNFLPAQLLLSQAYRSQGNFKEAERVLNEQLKATPNETEPHLLLALIYLQQGKRAGARQTLETVNRLDPRNVLAVYHLVELDLAEKEYGQALVRTQRLSQALPNHPGPHYILAKVCMAQGLWSEAEAALKKSIEVDPNFSGAYELLISMYVKTDQLRAARGQMEEFLAKNPENIGALQTFGLLQESLADLDGARETYHRVLSSNPDAPVALNNLAVIYATKLKQLDKAYEFASRARNLRPEDGAIADTLGWIVYQRQDYPQAISLLQEAVERLPAVMEVHYHLGMAYYMSGQKEAARDALTRAAAAPESFPGKDEIPKALAMIGNSPTEDLTAEQLHELLRQRPADLVVRQKLGEILEKSGDHARAAALWEEGTKANPKQALSFLKLAGLYDGPLKDPQKALVFARKARALDPGDVETAKLAGRVAWKSGEHVWAHSLLSETAVNYPEDGLLLVDLGWAEYSLGQVEEARKTMERASKTKLPPNTERSVRTFLSLTRKVEGPGELAQALAEANSVLAENPDDVPAMALRAEAAFQQNRASDASADFKTVLRHYPQFTPAQRRLAQLYFTERDAQAAYDLAKVVRQKSPDDREIGLLLAELTFGRGDYVYSAQLLQECEKVRPLEARGLYLLGMAEWRSKNEAGARERLEAAIKAGLADPDLSQAQAVLSGATPP